MNYKTKTILLGIYLLIVGPLLVMLQPGPLRAKLPEPDNIIYGLADPQQTTSVSVKVAGVILASYTMGENPDAGDYYVLRVPMESLDPSTPGSAREGDTAAIHVNGGDVAVASLTLTGRGTVYKLNFVSDGDDDGDGLPDDWEQQIIDADPADDIETIYDVLPGDDFDGDGDSNGTEYTNNTDPTDGPQVMAGDLNNDGNVDLVDAILGLMILTQTDTAGEEIQLDADVDGNGYIDSRDLIYILQKVSNLRGN